MPRQSTEASLAAIRAAAFKALRNADREAERIFGRKELYKFVADGTKGRMRIVSKAGAGLITKAAGFAVDDVTNLERGDDEWVIAVVRDRVGRLEIYVIPKTRVIADMRAHQEHWLDTHPDGKSKVRGIYFDGDPAHPGKGFRQKYRDFLVTTIEPTEQQHAEPAPTGDELPLELALRKTAIAASFEYGRPVDQIRITIGVTFRTGEALFHWPAPANGAAHARGTDA